MAKYTSNEQYERDKTALIRIAKGNMVNLIENADVIADLLNQSKWIGLQEAEIFKRHVFNAIFDAISDHGVVPDKAAVAVFTNIAYDSFLAEVNRNVD